VDLHRRYGGVLYDRCLLILGDRAAAEDAVQETFFSAFRSWSSYRGGPDGHLPWLYSIATNACRKTLRTQRRKGVQLVENLDEAVPVDPNPVEVIYSRQVLDRIAAQLDDRGFTIFVAHYVDGVDQTEIARQLGLSRRAVVKRLTRLRQLLAEQREE
jgi:RNA polymerase sigma-70 factor (ECF subfamily)